jgi:hypothetical protein
MINDFRALMLRDIVTVVWLLIPINVVNRPVRLFDIEAHLRMMVDEREAQKP